MGEVQLEQKESGKSDSIDQDGKASEPLHTRTTTTPIILLT